LALAAAAVLFAAGCLTGARTFPVRQEVRVVQRVEVPVERVVEVPVERVVQVPVERVVRVPVEKQVPVTRWRTRTVTRVVYRDRPAAAPVPERVVVAAAPPPRPSSPERLTPVAAAGVPQPAVIRTAERPATVRF
jgi:hypothetical protein